jgi:hypothetical protein
MSWTKLREVLGGGDMYAAVRHEIMDDDNPRYPEENWITLTGFVVILLDHNVSAEFCVPLADVCRQIALGTASTDEEVVEVVVGLFQLLRQHTLPIDVLYVVRMVLHLTELKPGASV